MLVAWRALATLSDFLPARAKSFVCFYENKSKYNTHSAQRSFTWRLRLSSRGAMDRARKTEPRSNKLLYEAELRFRKECHDKKMRSVKASVDNSAPKGFGVVRAPWDSGCHWAATHAGGAGLLPDARL